METLTLNTNMHCESCVNKMNPILEKTSNVLDFSFKMNHPDKLAIITGENLDLNFYCSWVYQYYALVY